MRARVKTTAVIGVLLALALAFATSGRGCRPGGREAREAQEGEERALPPDFFGIVPIFAPTASDAQQMAQRGGDRAAVFLLGAPGAAARASTTGPLPTR